MKKVIYSAIIVVTMTFSGVVYPVSAQQLFNNPEISIGGFGDYIINTNPDIESDHFSLHQAEIGVNATFESPLSVTLAVALDDEKFSIGSFVISYLLDSSIFSPPSKEFLNTVNIEIGQFDIPLGLDWEKYASIDRELITPPLTSQYAHEEWNDIGLSVFTSGNYLSSVFFIVNGYSHEHLLSTPAITDNYQSIAIGTRLTGHLTDYLDIGLSMATIEAENNLFDSDFWGFDCRLSLNPLTLSAEYLSHYLRENIIDTCSHEGYYLQAQYDLSNWYAVIRYGEYDQSDKIYRKRSIGLGRHFYNAAVIRAEYITMTGQDNNLLMQVAVSF